MDGKYEIVPRPKPFRPSAEPTWPVDAILATVNSGDAVRVPHDKAGPECVGRGNSRKSARVRLLTLMRHGLRRRGYIMGWAPAGDEAVDVWASKAESEEHQ